MAGQKTSNHDLTIATKGSGHKGVSPPGADTCYVIKPDKIYPNTNIAPSSNLKTGETQSTFIEGHSIWTELGVIDAGALPTLPPHIGIQKGTNKPGYCAKAWATDWSKDLKIEKGGVVRTDDPTKQNLGNCDGKVVASLLPGDAKNTRKEKDLRCMITKISGECSHKRKLSAPKNKKTNDGFTLDVWDDDTITLKAEKVPIADGLPECKAHVHWLAKNPTTFAGQLYKEEKVAAEFKVSGKLLEAPFVMKLKTMGGLNQSTQRAGNASLPSTPQTGTLHDNRNATVGDWMSTSQRGTQVSTFGTERGALSMGTTSETSLDPSKQVLSKQGAAIAGAIAGNFDTFLSLLMYANSPTVCTVTATGCAGAKTITLRSFPKDEFKLDLIEKLIEAFRVLRTIKETFERVGKFLNQKWEFTFLASPVANITFKFVELKEDKNGFFQSQIRRSWTINLGFSPIISGTFSITLPVVQVFPAGGAVVDKILRALGLNINLVVEISVAASLTASVTSDEYDEKSASGTFKIAPKFTIRAEAVADVLGGLKGELSASAWVEGEVAATIKTSKTHVAEATISGFIQLGYKLVASGDLWGFYEAKYETPPEDQRPEDWRVPAKNAPPWGTLKMFPLTAEGSKK